MEFGINYSTQAAQLLASGLIKLDRFKTPDWPDMIQEAQESCPVAVHFELRAGNGTLAGTNWQRIDRIREQTTTPYINLHLDPRIKHYAGFAIDTTDPADTERILNRLIEDVNSAAEFFGADRIIAENVPYRGWDDKSLRPAVVPAHIRRVLQETGCGLLLDIAHARISAAHLGMDERDYIRQLPVQKLRELHFNGVHRLGNRLQDHLEALEADWQILEWVFERINGGEWPCPWLLVFEYGGMGEKFIGRSEIQVIASQAPRLYEMVENIKPS
jgi:uncharacterized protein